MWSVQHSQTLKSHYPPWNQHLKIDGWKTIVSFWGKRSICSGVFAVSCREGHCFGGGLILGGKLNRAPHIELIFRVPRSVGMTFSLNGFSEVWMHRWTKKVQKTGVVWFDDWQIPYGLKMHIPIVNWKLGNVRNHVLIFWVEFAVLATCLVQWYTLRVFPVLRLPPSRQKEFQWIYPSDCFPPRGPNPTCFINHQTLMYT